VLGAAWLNTIPLFIATFVASVFTALYSARIFGLVFLGSPSEEAQKAQSVRAGLVVPLLVMAGLIPLGLLANASLLGHPLTRLLGVPAPDVPTATALTLVAALVGSAAGLWARFVWPRALVWPVLSGVRPLFGGEFGLKTAYRLVARSGLQAANALGTFDRVVFDTLAAAVVKAILTLSRRCSVIDRRIFDAFAVSLAKATLALVRVSGRVDRRGFDDAVRTIGQDMLAISQRLRSWQTGRIENYLLAVFMWGLGVMVIAVFVIFVR
jgi:NADH:ubiquinone oxidoreductase subunit 5 (subunit L)/multisubunit Na+/H+ antiporter MnhA subunit